MAKQTFTVGQVLTASQLTSLQATALGGGAASAKTASYTLVSADAGTTISMTSTSATTITVNTGLFAAGDTVFIQNLGSGVTTITAGTATVNTSASLALAQYEGGTLFFTSASASLFFKADGAAAGGGKVLQVVTAFKSDTFAASDSAYQDVTGLSVSITPSSATSKVLVMMTVTGSHQPSIADAVLRLVRDSTAIAVAGTAGDRTLATVSLMGPTTTATDSTAFTFLDSPSTTSATTYKVQGTGNGATPKGFYINRGSLDTDTVSVARTASSITVMEIGA
jgi:hypothetical protein